MPKPKKEQPAGRKERSKANGEGTIYWEPDRKRYRGEWYPPGATKPLRCRFEKKTDVVDQIAKWKTEHAEGTLTRPTKDTVGDLLTIWMKEVISQRKPTTQHTYKGIVKKHLMPKLGNVLLSKLTPKLIQTAYHEVRSSGVSDYTVRNVHAVLHSCLEYATANSMIPRNHAANVARPEEPEADLNILTPAQGRLLLEAAKPERFYVLWLMALLMGLRMGELLGLRWRDIDFESGTISIRQTISQVGGKLIFNTPKSRAGRRIWDAPPIVLEALQWRQVAYAKERKAAGEAWQENDLVICTGVGTPYSLNNLSKRDFKRVMIRADLTHQEEYRAKNNKRLVKHTPICRFHDLRHTALTVIGMATKSVKITQELAGHASSDILLKRYTHVFRDSKQSASDAVQAFWMTPPEKH